MSFPSRLPGAMLATEIALVRFGQGVTLGELSLPKETPARAGGPGKQLPRVCHGTAQSTARIRSPPGPETAAADRSDGPLVLPADVPGRVLRDRAGGHAVTAGRFPAVRPGSDRWRLGPESGAPVRPPDRGGDP